MKIWCQSCTPLGTEEPWNTYQRSLERRLGTIVRPDTTVDLHGTEAALQVESSCLTRHKKKE